MARHALATGRALPEWTVELLAAIESREEPAATRLPELVRTHQELAALVAPALPQALVLLERERRRGGILRSFGPVRLVRQLILASALFLGAFVASSLSPYVDAAGGDVFETSGSALLANQLFLLSAAGVGASFAALFRVNRYLTEGTYDPRYDASYWIRFLLGLIAGVVLAALIPVGGQYSRPLLALGGGFAAPVVYRVLTRIVEGLESVGGSPQKKPPPAEPPTGPATRSAVAPAAAAPSAPDEDTAVGPVLAAVTTDEGATAVVAAAAPGGSIRPQPAPAEIPPELEGSYRARIVFEGGHVGAAHVLDGPALVRAAAGKLKTIARAAAVAKIGAELSGPFGEVFSNVAGGDDGGDMTVVVENGVATGALHEWAAGRADAPEREIAVDLYDEGGARSSTLKLEDSRVKEYEFEEDPKRPGSYLIRRLVLEQTRAEWLVGALNPVEEARKLFAKPDAPAPPPPCRGSFARGVAAGLLLALMSVGAWSLQNDEEPVVAPGRTSDPDADCDEDSLPSYATCPPSSEPTSSPEASEVPTATPTTKPPDSCPPTKTCEPFPEPCPPVCPSPSPPICPPLCPSPSPPICPPLCPSPSPPPSPSPLDPRLRRCKQPPDAVVRSEAHARHPGCALYHSEAEPPGHALPPSATPPPPGAPAPMRPVAPVATAPPKQRPGPRPPDPPSPRSSGRAPESENAPALPPGLEKRKDGLPPGLQKRRRPRRPSRPA